MDAGIRHYKSRKLSACVMPERKERVRYGDWGEVLTPSGPEAVSLNR